MKKFILALNLLLAPTAALGQSPCPKITNRTILTAADWQACLSAKEDNLGFTPLNRAGDSMTGELKTVAPAATGGFNLTPGYDPSSPQNGDLWATSQGIMGYAGGQKSWLGAPVGMLRFTAPVNFNTVDDTAIPISLPPGCTRYLVHSVTISAASASLTTASIGVFTQRNAGGLAIVTGTAVTVSNATDATVNNTQTLTPNNAGTESYLLGAVQTALYTRIIMPEGSAATANVSVTILPLR